MAALQQGFAIAASRPLSLCLEVWEPLGRFIWNENEGFRYHGNDDAPAIFKKLPDCTHSDMFQHTAVRSHTNHVHDCGLPCIDAVAPQIRNRQFLADTRCGDRAVLDLLDDTVDGLRAGHRLLLVGFQLILVCYHGHDRYFSIARRVQYDPTALNENKKTFCQVF